MSGEPEPEGPQAASAVESDGRLAPRKERIARAARASVGETDGPIAPIPAVPVALATQVSSAEPLRSNTGRPEAYDSGHGAAEQVPAGTIDSVANIGPDTWTWRCAECGVESAHPRWSRRNAEAGLKEHRRQEHLVDRRELAREAFWKTFEAERQRWSGTDGVWPKLTPDVWKAMAETALAAYERVMAE